MTAFTISQEDKDIIVALNNGGEKIASIKLARQASGAGLREAKAWVDSGCPVDSPIEGDIWKVIPYQLTVAQLVDKLFSLSKEMAEVHRTIEKMQANSGGSDEADT